MTLLTKETTLALWQEVVRGAEGRCEISLNESLESYLVSLLIRFTNKPELADQLLATAFIEALRKQPNHRQFSLQQVGDHCLLFAGFFPDVSKKKRVTIKYFVDLGRSAYSSISGSTNDLYGSLAFQFVSLMDILQTIREKDIPLMPLDAYEQWHLLGSKRALSILKSYSHGLP